MQIFVDPYDLNRALRDGLNLTVTGTSGLPAGGTTGQALVKNSAVNFDVSWQTIPYSPNLDGGVANSTYGAISPMDGGTA